MPSSDSPVCRPETGTEAATVPGVVEEKRSSLPSAVRAVIVSVAADAGGASRPMKARRRAARAATAPVRLRTGDSFWVAGRGLPPVFDPATRSGWRYVGLAP